MEDFPFPGGPYMKMDFPDMTAGPRRFSIGSLTTRLEKAFLRLSWCTSIVLTVWDKTIFR